MIASGTNRRLDQHQQVITAENASGEFEREPVPASKLKGWKSFLGMYAGEHAAGTEFMIGPTVFNCWC